MLHRPAVRSCAGLLLLLGLFLPPKLWRAGTEESLWLDETHSLVMASRTTGTIVELAADDAHPPLYFLGLKLWLRAGRELGLEPGTLWARSLNVWLWVLVTGAAWWLARRSLGLRAGALVAAAVAGSAAAATMVQDLRGYGFAWAGLTVAYLTLVDLFEEPLHTRGLWRWGLFVAAGTFAAWSHLLALLVLGCLSLCWILLVLPGPGGSRRTLRRTLAVGSAFGAMLVALAPWLLQVPGQWAGLTRAAPAWMTPATLENLFYTVAYWLPFGRLGAPDRAPFSSLVPLGAAAVLLPAGAALLCRRAGRGTPPEPTREGEPPLGRVAALGLASSLLAVLALWTLSRSGLAPVFHGPRYPLLVVSPWAGGLAALAAGAGRCRPPCAAPWIAPALLAPWLLIGLVAAIGAGLLEGANGLASALEGRAADRVHLMPPELAPFFRESLEGTAVRRIERLPCELARGADAVVLDLNPWRGIDRPRDQLARQVIAGGLLSREVESTPVAEGRLNATLYRLREPRAGAAETLCARGFVRSAGPVPADAPAVALPAEQRDGDGWSYPEVGGDLVQYRWSAAAEARIRFRGTLAPGSYTVHLRGSRPPRPHTTARVELDWPDGWARSAEVARSARDPAGTETGRFGRMEGENPLLVIELGPGRFHLRLPVRIAERTADPSLLLRHPTWSPAEAFGSADHRRIGWQLRGAWIE